MPSSSTEIFPTDVSNFATGGPVFRTLVSMSADGTEQRNSLSLYPRRILEINTGVLSATLADTAQDFFVDRIGDYTSFRVLDPFDSTATSQALVTVTGGKQLVKTYTHGAYSHVRPITKPINGTVSIVGGGTLDYDTGIVVGGSPTSWSGSFHVPMRFNADELIYTRDGGSQRKVRLQLVEVADVLPSPITGGSTTENLGSGNSATLAVEIGVDYAYQQRTHVVQTSLLSEDRFLDWTTAQRAVVSGKWLLSDSTKMGYLLSTFLVARGRRSRWGHDLLGTVRFASDELVLSRASFDSYAADLRVLMYIA